MSRDIQIAFSCPHLAIEERVGIDVNRRQLLLRRPLASTGLVRILANDKYFVPSAGLYSKAKLTGGFRGPFQIVSGANEFEIQTTEYRVSILLPTGNRVPGSEVVSVINAGLGTDPPITVTHVDGRIVIEEFKQQGQMSRILVGGSAADDIGFRDQKGNRGRLIIPGWEPFKVDEPFQTDGETTTTRGLRFQRPLKGNWNFKVTYSMEPNQCSRCLSAQVENDWRLDNTNDAITVENENLLVQATQKILLTVVQSNPYHPWYGTSLQQRIGSKAVGGTAAGIQEDVQRALEKFQALQRSQSKYQSVSAKERLYSIDSLRVYPFGNSQTAFTVDVVVRNASDQPVNVSIVYTVPGTVALTGTNGLTLGSEGRGVPAFLDDLALGN